MATLPLPANPFPGMNPYLERPDIWPEVHNRIIVGLADALTPRLQPDYAVRVQQRVYIDTEPGTLRGSAAAHTGHNDSGRWHGALRPEIAAAEPKPGASAVAVALPATELLRQRYLQVLRADNMEVIAIIEVLSPSNKSGSDRRDYLTKRTEVERSAVHLVEIDLLLAGPPMPVIGDAPPGLLPDYRRQRPAPSPRRLVRFRLAGGDTGVHAAAGERRRRRQRQPERGIEPRLFHGSYNMFINYGQDPEPPLSEDGPRLAGRIAAGSKGCAQAGGNDDRRITR